LRRLLIVAGPNGSGKSTFTTPQVLAQFGIRHDRYINADNVQPQISSSMPDLTPAEMERAAFTEARDLRRIYREEGISFAFETVFSHPSTFLDIRACQQAGFEIVVIFVTTRNPLINVARVERRVRGGGHNVNTQKIIDRYDRSMSFLPKIVEEADQIFVYDNSGEIPQLSFSFLRPQLYSYSQNLPPFFDNALRQPLLTRRAELDEIQSNYGSVNSQTIYQGEIFEGEVIFLGQHYLIQSTGQGPVLHDLCLFSGLPPAITTGSHITIRYGDGDGNLESGGDRNSCTSVKRLWQSVLAYLSRAC
jgi:predicted ABC-type ATPase